MKRKRGEVIERSEVIKCQLAAEGTPSVDFPWSYSHLRSQTERRLPFFRHHKSLRHCLSPKIYDANH